MIDNIAMVRDYRRAKDIAEGVKLAQELRAVFAEHLSPEDYLFACSLGLDEIRERCGTDYKLHERNARRLLEKIVSANKGLVAKVVKRTLGPRAQVEANLEEAMQEGSMGLVRAIEAFDEERGSFSTCAGYWIRYYAQVCMARQGDFVKQRHSCMPAPMAKKANVFRLEHGREPTAEDMGVSPAQWASWLEEVFTISLDELGVEGSNAVGEHLEDPSQSPDITIHGISMNDKMAKAMAEMSPRNRKLVQSLFIDGLPLKEAGDRCGLSLQRTGELKGLLESRLRKALFT